MIETIDAKDVVIREFSGRKCNKVRTGTCPIQKERITRDMVNLTFFGEDGCYVPDDFCLGLAAKYLFDEDRNLFHSFKCFKYSCGHLEMASDGNHRMCVLQHLGEKAEVEVIEIAIPCSACASGDK